VFYKLIYEQWVDSWTPLNVFQYITFRASLAAVTSLLICLFCGPWVIRRLRELKVRQGFHTGARAEAMGEHHKDKVGTPTMGGVLIVTAIVVSTLMWARLDTYGVWLALGGTFVLGGVGFVDDYLKLAKESSDGAQPKGKLVGQVLVGAGVAAFLLWGHKGEVDYSVLALPFFKDLYLPLGLGFLVLSVLVVVGTSNAVNLTDGLDGLAIGCIAVTGAAYTAVSYVVGRTDYTQYLNVMYVPGAGELTVFCAALCGASLGFLWYNSYPASVFMGDTGALALGGALALVAILVKQELSILLLGGVFVLEALSVILQVTSYKLTGKRIFKVAPFHHHLERMGWPEPKIVARIWIIAIILAVVGLSTVKIR